MFKTELQNLYPDLADDSVTKACGTCLLWDTRKFIRKKKDKYNKKTKGELNLSHPHLYKCSVYVDGLNVSSLKRK